ncbi:ATP-binding cassette domain-containing protein [Halodesulfovibrio aestuarii]|uniref:ATP-binding cassette domain-containing protein n=1 Tax=Halodesulfovibrio aestuarii TaxID=126333 RepID=A0ABV4JSY6_9BACT
MTLSLSVSKQLENITVQLETSCPSNTLTAIVGPSGSGKTTLIRMLAGLETPDSGTITCNDAVWFSSTNGVTVPPQSRRVGLVFQDYTLFPHLTVEKNILFAAVTPKTVPDLLQTFGIEHIKHKKPHSISGGERQRAAFCQALAREPVALLLDEPFSALDVTTRRKLQHLLLEIKTRLPIPIIHVTHDLEEATMLGDTIIAMEQGKVSPNWLNTQLLAAHHAAQAPLPYEQCHTCSVNTVKLNTISNEKQNASTR